MVKMEIKIGDIDSFGRKREAEYQRIKRRKKGLRFRIPNKII